MNPKQLFQKSIILPLLIGISYLCLFLDTIKYPGFVGNHFLLDAKVYLAASIVLILIPNIKDHLQKWIFIINLLILAVSGVGYVYFSFVEAAHYPNYVLAVYHFHLDGLVYFVLFSLLVFILGKIKTNKIFVPATNNLEFVILVFFVVYALSVNAGSTLETSFENNFYILLHARDSYDQKMVYQWHDFYYYMLFVKTNTPDNATIIIPPQIAPWWTRSGNFNLVRSFLYPRKIIQYDSETIPDIKSLPKGAYVMTAWGEWGCDQYGCKGWPRQIIKSQEAIFKDPQSSKVKEVKINFIYDPNDTSNSFGLLKI